MLILKIIMKDEKINQLINDFLQQKYPKVPTRTLLAIPGLKELLSEAISKIDTDANDLLNLDEVDRNHPRFKVFFSILDKAFILDLSATPWTLNYQEDKLISQINLARIPDSNYVNRPVTYPVNADESQKKAYTNLFNIAMNVPRIKRVFDHSRSSIQLSIKNYEKQIGKEQDNKRKESLKKELTLLQDLYKIEQLKLIKIPGQDGKESEFYSLSESVGGVTEKVSLISKSNALIKLDNLKNNAPNDLQEYLHKRNDYKLSVEGIIKLPKHGKTTEVQREAIALNISRILGLRTTNSNMVEYEGKAALYVPFDKIELLKEVAKGEEKTAFIPSSLSLKGLKKIGEKYLHYSTISAVGNGLVSDKMIDDFGAAMGFSYLCNDTDFIGMENQNKAIVEGKHLYIFDQVIKTNKNMVLDSRLNLVPIGMKRHTRHAQGRNRSIVEDSTTSTKLDSIIRLLDKKEEINAMLNHEEAIHKANIDTIQKAINSVKSQKKVDKKLLQSLENHRKEVVLLRNDLVKVRKTINARMTSLLVNFPQFNKRSMHRAALNENKQTVMHSLILEKLANDPVLFAKDGRPYKNPWTYRNYNRIKSIETNNGMVNLTFEKLDRNKLAFILQQAGIDIRKCKKRWNTIQIPIEELGKITETSIFPELEAFDDTKDYLSIQRLLHIRNSYPSAASSNKGIAKIAHYHTTFKRLPEDSLLKKANLIKSTIDAVQKLCSNSRNKGFLKHLELNLQLDAQQKLRILIKQKYPDLNLDEKIEEAFSAALKLDRLNDFNQVFIAFVANSPSFEQIEGYLDSCINCGQSATDYNNAKTSSNNLKANSLTLFKQITPSSTSVMMRGLSKRGFADNELGRNQEEKKEEVVEKEALIPEESNEIDNDYEGKLRL